MLLKFVEKAGPVRFKAMRFEIAKPFDQPAGDPISRPGCLRGWWRQDLDRRRLCLQPVNPTSPTEGVGRRQAAEILGMQLQRSALQGMSAQSTSRLFRVVIFGGG